MVIDETQRFYERFNDFIVYLITLSRDLFNPRLVAVVSDKFDYNN